MMTAEQKYFQNFFDEKEIPHTIFEVEHNGELHMVENGVVIDLIKTLSGQEAKSVRDTLVKIDLHNGNVNHFLEHLANGYIKSNF
jgi:hypothetical protein